MHSTKSSFHTLELNITHYPMLAHDMTLKQQTLSPVVKKCIEPPNIEPNC